GGVVDGIVMPEANLMLGAATGLDVASGKLIDSIDAWEPTLEDAFTAMVVMTPTMNEYFEQWKLSSFVSGDSAEEAAFVGQSRLFDVVNILNGLNVTYDNVAVLVEGADGALDEQISAGYTDLRAFVGDLYDQELDGNVFSPEEADLFGTEAQDKATAISGQVAQAAAQLSIAVDEEFDMIVPDSAAVDQGIGSAPSGEAMASSDSFPVTLDHKYGSTTIEDRPLRVVSVGYSEQDELLALGVTPVGLRAWYGGYDYEVWPWAQDELGDATPVTISTEGALNFEAITELNPDLIVGVTSGMTEEEYNFLSEIAPTLPQSGDYVDFGVPWQEVSLVLGQAVGEADAAENLVTGIEDRFAQIRADYPEWQGATMAVAFWFNEVPGVYASEDARPRLLSEMGFVTPPEYDELAGDSFFVSFSEEEMPTLLDVDLIVWIAADDAAIQAIKDEPLRAALPAAQEGREIFLNQLMGGAFSFSSPLSLDYLLDEMVPMIEAAMDGDPNTIVPEAGEASASSDSMADVSPLPRTVVDYEGNEVVIEDDSVLIPVDGPLTEIVYALGMGDKVVATDTSSTYPPVVEDLPRVGYVRRLSAEPILALAPTLILTTDDANPPEAVEQLKESGVTVAQFKAANTVEESMQLVRDVAAALGVEERGEELVAKMEADLEEAAALLDQVDTTPRVMMIYARGVDVVSAAGSGTSVDIMFELAGVENAVTEWEGYQPLTAEGAVTIAPDALLLFDSGLASVGGPEGLVEVPGIAETPAGADMNIYSMDGLLLTGLGPRVGEAVIELIKMLHPELD
ncbi:MAG: ABC transporter substrate-binding protein, partial [Chloroflexota bacterium]